ncbi:MAG: hypothetical protein ABIM89_17455, partial [Mycobacteriales bacterium]
MSEIHADPDRCPECAQPHGGGASCTNCGLRLRGPAAVELWNLTQRIEPLLHRRRELLRALREPDVPTHARLAPPWPAYAAAPSPLPASAAGFASADPAPAPSAIWSAPDAFTGEPQRQEPRARPKAEWSQQRVQNTLLILGVLLLAIAALIFTVVSWGSMGVVGRAAILLLVTAAVAAGAPALASRGLSATAEALAALAIALVVIDAQGARQSVPSLSRIDARIYWAVAAAVIAALSAAYAGRVKLETPQYAAVLASQLPGALLALRLEDQAGAAVLLFAQASLAASVATRWPRPQIVRCLVGAASVAALAGASLAVLAAYGSHVSDFRTAVPGAVALVAAGATSAWMGWLVRDVPEARVALTAVAAIAATAAVFALALPTVHNSSLPAVVGLCALGCVVAGIGLGREWGIGPTAVGSTAAILAVLAEADDLFALLFGPLTWVNRSWTTFDVTVSARTLLSSDRSWPGEPSTLLTVVAVTVGAALLARRHGNRAIWLGVLAPGLALSVIGTPLAFNWSYGVAITWELTALALAIGIAVRVAPMRPHHAAIIADAAGGLLVAHAVPWSLANEQTAHAALAVTAVVASLASATRQMF